MKSFLKFIAVLFLASCATIVKHEAEDRHVATTQTESRNVYVCLYKMMTTGNVFIFDVDAAGKPCMLESSDTMLKYGDPHKLAYGNYYCNTSFDKFASPTKDLIAVNYTKQLGSGSELDYHINIPKNFKDQNSFTGYIRVMSRAATPDVLVHPINPKKQKNAYVLDCRLEAEDFTVNGN